MSEELSNLENLLLRGRYSEIIEVCNENLTDPKSTIYLGYTYYLLGKYNTSLEYFNEHTDVIHSLDTRDMIIHHITEAMITTHIGYNKAALKILTHVRDEINELMKNTDDVQNILGKYYIAKGNYEWNFGNFPAAIYNYEEAIEIFSEINEFRSIVAKLGLAEAFRSMGRFKESWVLYEEIETWANSVGNASILSLSQVNRAISAFNTGDYRFALNQANEALKNSPIEGLVVQSLSYNLIGNIHLLRGELTKAEKNFLLALDYRRQSGDIKRISSTYSNLGRYYFEKGESEEAISCFRESLEIINGTANYLWELKPTFHIIQLLTNNNRNQEAEIYLNRLIKIDKHINSDLSVQYLQLGEALIYQNRNRMKDQTEAQRLYQEVIQGPMVHFENTKIAYLKMCEILLTELKLFYNEEIIQEIEHLLSRLETIVKEQKSFSFLVELHLIQARFQLLMGNYEKSDHILNQAIRIASKHKFDFLNSKLKKEQNFIKTEIQKWKAVVSSNSNLIKKLERTDLEQYIDTLASFVEETDF